MLYGSNCSHSPFWDSATGRYPREFRLPGIGPMMHAHPLQALSDAHERDRDAAAVLQGTLVTQGRTGHPALPVLDFIRNGPSDAAARAQIVAIAFEASVRVMIGARHGPAVESDRIDLPEHLLVRHDCLPWDPPEKRGVPHVHVDWRAAMADGAAALAAGDLRLRHDLPGAAMLSAMAASAADKQAFVASLLGDSPRDDTLDPVAAGGNFLAQAVFGFVDIEEALRALRERQLARRTT